MKAIKLFVVLLGLAPLVLPAQNEVDFSVFKGGKPLRFNTVEYLENTQFCEYNIKNKPHPVHTNELPANNKTPENLIALISKTADKEAIKKFFLQGAEALALPELPTPLEKVDSANYFLITEKLIFDHHGKKTAILKYFKITPEGQSRPFSIQLQQRGNSWFIVHKRALKDLEFLIRHLKYKVLYKFLQKGYSGDEEIDAIAKKCLSVEHTLNYKKLYLQLKDEFEHQTALAERIGY